jgi:asparagine synthase (glutamine-hydrolysing)
VREALQVAVRRRTVSDVDVGVLLSGGLDSSLLVALLAEEGVRPSSFSIGFRDRDGVDGDEFVYSDAVAQKFGTDHHQLRVGDEQMALAVEHAVGSMSEPMGSHDVTAFHLVCREVSRHIKVVQCGQGADEVFAGYRYHQPAAAAARHQAADVFRDAFHDVSHHELPHVLEPGWLLSHDVSSDLTVGHLAAPGADTALDAVLRTDTHLLMPDDPVKRVDNMAMAWGVEARVPFLDQDLVELVAACPPELKSGQDGKGILKDIGRDLLPVEVVDRPKGYFPVPALTQLDGEVLDLLRSAMSSPAARRRGVLRREYVDALLADPNGNATKAGGNELWHLGVLELWLQQHGIG